MKIYHNGRSQAVNRAMAGFGIEESFQQAAKRFKEHHNFEISPGTVARVTKKVADKAEIFMNKKFSEASSQETKEIAGPVAKLLVEVDGCEIRTAQLAVIENSTVTTPVYNNPNKKKSINWRDVRLGFARPLESDDKLLVGRMDSYPVVIDQLHTAALKNGMTPSTVVVGVADGGNGLAEELKRRFPNMVFVLDKPHLKDHLYATAEELGIPLNERAKWVEPKIRDISAGKLEMVMETLQKLYSESGNPRLRRLLGYIQRFKDALYYDEFKKKGYPIGSGEIENAHKSVPQKRLKIPGASWHPDSINPMMSLRVL